MPTIFSPNITQADHNTFRRFIKKDFPDTYDKWLKLHTDEITDHPRVGRVVREIEVDSHEFANFLHARGKVANLKTLREFTFEKAFRDSDR